MKTRLLKVAIVPIILALIIVVSCNEEKIAIKDASEQSAVSEEIDDVNTSARSGRLICIYYIEHGLKLNNHCYSYLPGICSIRLIRCIPLFYERCLFPCDIKYYDPWDVYKFIDPYVIPDIRDKFQLKVDPEVNTIPFPINEAVVGLQFYTPIEKTLDKDMFMLKSDLQLDPELAKELGLRGNVIPAGEYPVAYNEKFDNYNAIVAVKDIKIRK